MYKFDGFSLINDETNEKISIGDTFEKVRKWFPDRSFEDSFITLGLRVDDVIFGNCKGWAMITVILNEVTRLEMVVKKPNILNYAKRLEDRNDLFSQVMSVMNYKYGQGYYVSYQACKGLRFGDITNADQRILYQKDGYIGLVLFTNRPDYFKLRVHTRKGEIKL